MRPDRLALTPDIANDLPANQGLDIFVRKLLSHSALAPDDQQALRLLPFTPRRLDAGDYILREGERSEVCPLLLSGLAYRHKFAADGGRQIVALKMPGDALDLQSLFLRVADHNLQALTVADIAIVPIKALEQLVRARGTIARALLVDILIEASIGREWLLNIGRRNALSRLAHFLCELVYRLHVTTVEPPERVDVPITQEQLADLLGLTPVHINRTLRSLEDAGGIIRQGRKLVIGDVNVLRGIASYSDIYLHRGQQTG
ncbi:Crp/Fnr family transcriptional regulator [Sphingopyxis flava]|uniref:cAMP-binding domain of CRP or a regulatory subunit of cAMP-dependent protein kinases n=1 Tax=Sphingopyxis flava TaxID=1507287 RepID=A0A1T5F3J4_9SPHN|nr:Crp/Fnr family transcriptional regulator [Sphingopyxis flava]SKB90706.1 cAMP-binding domain of CRP or a regulatory subunit of cAMP-dependent protein kinases [Sphingopyxis flava]